MAALNTNEVTNLLHQIAHRPGVMAVLGVFPADCLPSARQIQNALQHFTLCCFVANTDPAIRPGKHWVAFIATSVRVGDFQLEYFDSYGFPLALYTDLYAGCARNHFLPLIRVFSTVCLQDTASSVCGHYCVLFAHFRAMGLSFMCIIRYFRSLHALAVGRDKLVVRTLHSVLRRGRPTMFTALHCLIKGSNYQSCCCNAAQ